MIEEDRDGRAYTNVLRGKIAPVDAHSTLVVAFPKAPAIKGDPPGPEWKRLESVLEYLDRRAAEWNELNKRVVDPRDSNAVARLQREAGAVAAKGARLVLDLVNFGFSQEEARAIFLGEASGIARPSTNGYLNLAQWATNHWGRLHAAAEAYQKSVASNSQVRVTLQATRRSLSGGNSLLHIEEWDNLDQGNYSPIDRTGLRPTEAEQKRLETERQAAEAVASLIRSAKTNDVRLKGALKEKLNEFEEKLSDLQRSLRAAFDAWDANPPTAISNRLQSLVDTGAPEIRTAAGIALTNLQAFKTDFQVIDGLVQSVRRLRDTLRQGENRDPLDLLLGGSGLVATGQNMIGEIQRLLGQMTNWPTRINGIETNAPVLVAALAQDGTKLWPQSVKDAVTELQRDFPVEFAALQTLWSMVAGALPALEASDAIAKSEEKLISHTLDDLVDGRLDLKYGGLAHGDLVSVKLRATNTLTGKVIENVSYQHEVGLMGLHGKPAVHLIFARALSGSGDADEWKPNVAVAVEWHYTIREPQSASQKAWNWLYPGLGIHLASLDQGEDNFEIGAGVNISFWDGLLTAGYGYNFSGNDEPQYVFIGVNLLSAFNQARNRFFGK